MKIFWNKARKFRTIFNQEIRDDFEKFVSVILTKRFDEKGNISFVSNGLFWVVDDFVGVFYLTSIQRINGVNSDGLAHYSFFDGRHEGRIDLVRAMLRYAFQTFDFRRLSVEIPKYNTDKTRNFVEKSLRFKCEGKRRKAALFDNEFFDVSLYGILKEEVL